MIGDNKTNKAIIRQVTEMGFLKNMDMLPPDIRRDWRRELSSIGPKTNAITKGVSSYSSFLRT
jgi:hypothetical protein